jgi:hypothetical protein
MPPRCPSRASGASGVLPRFFGKQEDMFLQIGYFSTATILYISPNGVITAASADGA